jgi:signal peptidase I
LEFLYFIIHNSLLDIRYSKSLDIRDLLHLTEALPMPKFRPIHTTMQLALGTVLLALLLRTWLVMGLVEPITVAGSSMAPTLDSGDRLWIDRTTFERRRPRRGEVVVLRNPHDGLQMCVKRVVGLPGETVEIVAGDVWVDGQPRAKTLVQQQAVRQLVHRQSQQSSRWHADASDTWQRDKDVWRSDSNEQTRWHWLRYVHPNDQPITDDVATNVGLSRRLNLVRDFSLSTKLRAQGGGQIALELNDGRRTLRVTLLLPEGTLSLTANEKLLSTTTLSAACLLELKRGAATVEFSNFDRQLLLAVGSRVELRHVLAVESQPLGTSSPFAVGVAGLQVSLGELTLYRDIYYTRQPVGEAFAAQSAVHRLGSNEYYLLGDNSPISIDSRRWGGVSGRLLLGRPGGVR